MGAALVLLLVGLGAIAAGVLIGRYYVPDDRQLRRTARHSRAYMRALSHLVARDHDTAVSELRTVVEENVDDVEPYFALGAMFRSKGEHERAIRVHQALALREHNKRKLRQRAMYELGLDFRAAGMPRRATRAMEEVVLDEPDHEGALRVLAALYEEQARFNEAAGLWQRLGRRRGEDTGHREHHLLVAAAQAALGRGDLDAAKQLLKTAQKHEESSHFFAAAAELAAARGNHRGARDRLKQALIADPALAPHLLPALIAAEQGLAGEAGDARDARVRHRADDLDDDADGHAAASHAALPVTSQLTAHASQPAFPAASQPAFPAASQSALLPAASQLALPAATQPAFPAASQPALPAASQPALPAASQQALTAAEYAEAAPLEGSAHAVPTSAARSSSASLPASAAITTRTQAAAVAALTEAVAEANVAPHAQLTGAEANVAPHAQLTGAAANVAPHAQPTGAAANVAPHAQPTGAELAATAHQLMLAMRPASEVAMAAADAAHEGLALVPAHKPAATVTERVLAVLAEIEAHSGPRLELALIRAQLVPASDAAAQTALARQLATQFPEALAARVATARLALASGDAAAIHESLDALVSDHGALAWTLRGRWQCAHCGNRPTAFSWRCGQCRRWNTLRMETGIEPPPLPPRERRAAPRVARLDGLLGAARTEALPAPTLDVGLSDAETASPGTRRSLLGRVGGWAAGVWRRGAPS